MKKNFRLILCSLCVLFLQIQSSFAEANFVNKPIMPVFIDMISPASPFHKKDNIRFIDFLQTNHGKTVFIKSDLSFGTPIGENPEFADKYGLTDEELKLIGKKQIAIPIPINYNEPLNYIILHLLDNNELIFSSGGTGLLFTTIKGAFDVKSSVKGAITQYHLQERALSYTEEKDIINYIENDVNKISESKSQNLPIEIKNNNSDFIFPDSAINLIEQNELKHLNLGTLWQARNEIYARHGYYFKSQKALDFFKKFSWYTPNNSVKINLSEIEKNNVSRIKKVEEKLQTTHENDDFIFEDSNNKKLSLHDLRQLNADQLWISRNEIYAKNGYKFKSSKAYNHFKNYTWYSPYRSKAKLNPIEKYNVDLIRKVEMERISTTSPHGGLATVYNLFPEGDGFLSVKVAPSLKAKKIDEIYNDDIVKVINKNDNWSFIEYGDNFNKNGYVYNIYLRH